MTKQDQIKNIEKELRLIEKVIADAHKDIEWLENRHSALLIKWRELTSRKRKLRND